MIKKKQVTLIHATQYLSKDSTKLESIKLEAAERHLT